MAEWTAEEMPRLDGKTVVVTGANSGLGYEGTRAFAAKGATVVMACRSAERAETAADEIRADAGGDIDGELDVRECDLASLDSVRDFADRLAADYDAVDVLCNNAGVMAIPRSETEDGFETQFGVNHLGHFALTGRLFSLLKGAEGIDGDARIVTQSSGAHEQGEMDFSDLNWEESYGKWKAYGRSKLATCCSPTSSSTGSTPRTARPTRGSTSAALLATRVTPTPISSCAPPRRAGTPC